MFICLERVLDLGHPDAVKVFCEQMLELHRGQAQWSKIRISIRKLYDLIFNLDCKLLLSTNLSDVTLTSERFDVRNTINSNFWLIFVNEKYLFLSPSTGYFPNEILKKQITVQGMELYWRDNYQCPSEDDYRKMTIRKTGITFILHSYSSY